jgi:dTDP-4-dehydrorhamnose 3,5-epimerase
MITPSESRMVAAPGLSVDDFVADLPIPQRVPDGGGTISSHSVIAGVTATALTPHADERGSLSELLTTRDGTIEPIVHVYQVSAAAGSIRAWVYHRHQHDRLAFTNGSFEIVLYDLRPNSPTLNQLNVFRLGRDQPGLLRIPPLVIHGVRNAGDGWANFVNMPTRAYYPGSPDKHRIAADDPRIPYAFG